MGNFEDKISEQAAKTVQDVSGKTVSQLRQEALTEYAARRSASTVVADNSKGANSDQPKPRTQVETFAPSPQCVNFVDPVRAPVVPATLPATPSNTITIRCVTIVAGSPAIGTQDVLTP